MAENSENIEAKLCAYVEGDLDEQGKIEIERHLEAHPNHRRLLKELMATRDLLRFLPREQAPPELAEQFNAQLERSALLDGAGIDGPGGEPLPLRANLIPRLMAMAAIVLLAVGLGSVVFFALPRGESRARLAMPTDLQRGAATRAVLDGDESFARNDTGGAVAGEAPAPAAAPPAAPEARKEHVAKAAPADVADVFAEDRVAKGGPANGALAGAVRDDSNRIFDTRAGGGGGGRAVDPVYIIVSADNLDIALRDVTDNLSQSDIRWEPASEPAPEPVNLRQSQVSVAVASPRARSLYARAELDNALQKKASYQNQQQQRQQQYAMTPAAVLEEVAATGPSQSGQALARGGAKDGSGFDRQERQPIGQSAREQQPQQQPSQPAEESTTEFAKKSDAPAPAEPAAPPAAVASAESDAKYKARARQRSMSNVAEPSAEAEAIRQGEQVAQRPAAATPTPPVTQPQAQQVLAQHADAEVEDVAGVVAYGMTPTQVMELSRKLNKAPQAVELIADNEQLQVANETLRREQEQQHQELKQVGEFADAAVAEPVDAAQAPAAAAAAPAGPADAAAMAKREADAGAVAAEPSEPAKEQVAAKPSAGPARGGQLDEAAVKESTSTEAAEGQRAAKHAQRRASPARPAAPGSAAANADADTTDTSVRPNVNSRQGTGRPSGFIAPGQKLTVTIDELAGPDLGPTHDATVDAEGAIRLPKLDEPVRVEGLSRAQAERRIADAYRDGKVIDAPTVSVERSYAREAKAAKGAADAFAGATTAPTDETAATRDKLLIDAASAASAAPATTRSSGTALATTTTAPTEERLDVVILVQKNAAPAPAGTQSAPSVSSEAAAAEADQPTAPNASQRAADREPAAPAQPAKQ